MQKLPFPINSIPYQNVDPLVLDSLSDSLYDGFIDELGYTNKRPGLESHQVLGTANTIDGCYWWDNRSLVIFVSGGRIFKKINKSGTVVDITGDQLNVGVRPTFADNGDILVIANGGRMVYTDGTTPTQFIVDADAPTEVTHVAFLDQFLIANEVGSGRFRFADFVLAPTVWLAVDVFTAEANPDNIIALYVNKRVIHIFGTQSTEFWFNDGISPFSRLQGTTAQRGSMSPYTTVFANDIPYFFDDRRRLTRLIGQTPEIITTAFDKTIQNIETVNDAIADYVTVDGRNFIIFTFPSENRTFIFDIQVGYWAEWTYYNPLNDTRNRFLGNCYCYARLFNQHVFGSFKGDSIFLMGSNFYTDGGEQIRFEKTTGFIDHDRPDNRKRSYKLTLRLKRGIGIGLAGNTLPFMRIRWRNNGKSQWSNFRKIDLGVQGDSRFHVTTRNLGSYYERQWNIQMFEDIPFVIGKAVEGLDIGEF